MIRRSIWTAAATAAIFTATPVLAQDEATIVVTGSRSDRSDYNRYYDEDQSAIGLTRRADFFVTPIYVNSDTREESPRLDELYSMLEATIAKAEREGITLVAGRYTLEPLTRENMRDQRIVSAGRPDTSRVQIYARIPIAGNRPNVAAATESITEFVEDIPASGRSYIDVGSTGLAMRDPQQYRPDVVRAIAAESTSYAEMFGNGYGVEIRGLDSELYWRQASETEVFLYIEHSFVIRPR